MGSPTFHIAMYPWFALGHLTPFLHLSNKLAKKGHKISFLVPNKTQSKLQPFNLHPNLITFIPITVPHAPTSSAQTTSDVPIPSVLLMIAMDYTQDDIENLLRTLKVGVVFDFTHRMRFGSPVRDQIGSLLHYQSCYNWLHIDPRKATSRQRINPRRPNATPSWFGKPVLFSGLIILEPPTSPLEEKWAKWLAQFEPGFVIYCAFGSECNLKMNQFQELVLGLELSGFPFLAALKSPIGLDLVQAALPEKFETRVEQKGIVHRGWVQQQLILEHSSVGYFITHCGSGSLSEALVNTCELVLLPNVGDPIINARMMSRNLKVGVEVDK
ncbi:UDP-glycosyltransferase 79B9 [Camellia lanceoleosa]|uniref:UDP-glycosyltransferase 79B9 n=1 Tax=Camellia lanceoleosa TaxID=1840588 RepID=A0ACC0H8K1_9ERIC|nr:UDP-glycosyltransferase 79B9 [Camellia lanceoleosa]